MWLHNFITLVQVCLLPPSINFVFWELTCYHITLAKTVKIYSQCKYHLNIWLSSKIYCHVFCLVRQSSKHPFRSFMLAMNSRGSRIEPCSTPFQRIHHLPWFVVFYVGSRYGTTPFTKDMIDNVNCLLRSRKTTPIKYALFIFELNFIWEVYYMSQCRVALPEPQLCMQ